LGRGGVPRGISGKDAELRVRVERQSIGKQLHQGILQELTIAGLRLKALETAAAEPTASAIVEFSQWLRERQAELRGIVSQLEQGDPPGGGVDLAAIAADLRDRYGCDMSFDPQLQSCRFEPDIRSAMTGTVTGVTEVLAGALSAPLINVGLPSAAQPTLRITHDGERLVAHPETLVTVRVMVGRGGASLEIEQQGETETLTIDWAS